MKRAVLRDALPAALLAAGIILLDLIADRKVGGFAWLGWPHLLVPTAGLLFLLALLIQASARFRRAQAMSHEALIQLEERVRERTAALELSHEALRSEVAERKRIEQELRTSEETASALMNALPESAILLDTQGTLLASNLAAAQRVGVTVEQLVGSSLFDYFSPELAASRRAHLDSILQSGQPLRFVDERAGRTLDNHVNPVHDADGKVIRLAVFSQDITERKRADEALRASEEKYRLLFQNMTEGFALYELLYDEQGNPVDWRVLEVNDAYTRHTGVPRDQIVGRRISELFPGAIQEYLPRFATVVATQTPSVFETYAEAVGRHQRVFTFPAGGHCFANTIEDTSEHRRAEDALRASEEKFATVFYHSPDAIAILKSTNDKFVDVNNAFTALVGYARSEVLGRTWSDLGIIPKQEHVEMVTSRFRAEGVVAGCEVEFATKDGHVATVLLSLVTITLAGEHCVLAMAHDISSRRRSEAALRETQAELALRAHERAALEERQRLARELHDSVSQALYGISLGANTALTLFDTDRTRVREALDYTLALARTGLTEMRALIFELRPESLEREGLVAALTKQIEALQARHHIEIGLKLGEEPDAPFAMKEAIYRIAQEALQNAIRHAQSDRLDVSLARAPGGYMLEVCDNGVGFKPQAEYPGHLGLRSMRERAQRLGGTAEIHSEPGCGTLVRVFVPIADQARSHQ